MEDEKKTWKPPTLTLFGKIEDLTEMAEPCPAKSFLGNPGQWNQYYGEWLRRQAAGICS